MNKGILISFEGPDGAGKTSVLHEIVPALKQVLNRDIIVTREPGGVEIAECIRDVILNVNHTKMDAKTELLLYIAARRQHLVEKIIPALTRGDIVIVDRFIDSSVAYQGYGRGLDKENIAWLNHFAVDQYLPDLTILFDVSAEIGLARIEKNKDREVNRLDLEKVDMHHRVRSGYLQLAKGDSDRICKVDASVDFQTVVAEVKTLIKNYVDENSGK